MVTAEFKHSELSFTGGDDSNITSDLWFCGLEWGGEQQTALQPPVKSEQIPAWSQPDYDDACTAQYNQKICQFLHYYYQLEWAHEESYSEFVSRHKILYTPQQQGVGFKMNMLPLGFKNRQSIDQNAELIKLTGFSSFNEYRSWCIQYYGDFFRQAIEKHKPNLIICTGISEAENFIEFFTGNKKHTVKITPSYRIAYAQFNQTLICVIPFFGGANGINSYEKMACVVQDIKTIQG